MSLSSCPTVRGSNSAGAWPSRCQRAGCCSPFPVCLLHVPAQRKGGPKSALKDDHMHVHDRLESLIGFCCTRWDDTVDQLVKMGIDVNVKNDVDMTALHYAAWDATIETCQKLITLGIDASHKAKGKLSALDLAEKRSKEKAGRKVAEALKEAMGISDASIAAKEAETGDWVSAPDPEWRKVIEMHQRPALHKACSSMPVPFARGYEPLAMT